ncbi:SDR family oxidoreductase [Algoriphagus winogradskyi]|uniref:NAD(P)H dehydrogenase (Quinone) n=1 Tax=Algoriphagus winogradskyi TaxID=237017 RepID=A0ABY1PCH1_9BACT|nr:SDR family oxidoreductase [Algoriphagus winogradskyi]SMP29756.1 NAD(P)H dehydrogenase (quinone) [Algoriphagus winogradskyi]
MVLITGATGNYGKSTIDFLLQKGFSSSNIVALVRNEEKASGLKEKGIAVRVGDYDNYTQLVEAFEGIDKLLLISGSDMVNRDKQHQNAVNAAKEAGVNHIIYTSFERKNETETSPITFVSATHIATENCLKSSGLDYTILRNSLYMDMLPMFFGDKVVESGIFLPAGDTKAAFALRVDMAEATANILMTEGHENKTYNFSNSENVSIPEMAGIISEVVGKEIPYHSPSQEVYVETLTKANVPSEYIGMFAGFSAAIKQGEFTVENSDLEKILGRKPITAKEFLTKVYAS